MNCLDEGTLQAYLDSELAELRMRSVADHVEVCARCRDRMGHLASTMGLVNAWFSALPPEDVQAPAGAPRIGAPTPRRHWRWAAVGLAAVLAALAALFFAGMRPTPAKQAHSLQPPALQPQAGPPQVAAAAPLRAPVRRLVRRPKPRRATEEFVPLDGADPMQIGMVVRVMLPVSDASVGGGVREIAADVAIGEDGRARAIRFVR
jgi:Putative zinc-finger